MTRGNFESNKLFIDKVGTPQIGHKVLEIGSGYGTMVRFLRDQGIDIVGTEVNKEYIKLAKEEHGVDLLQIDGTSFPFEGGSFDVVLSFDVLEHIKDTNKHLDEVNRVLRSGGYYLLGVPNKLTNIPAEIIKEKSFTKWRSYHCSLNTYWGLKKIFHSSGFDAQFIDIPVVNHFFKKKIENIFGPAGLHALKVLNPDKLPYFLRTNFYLVAKAGNATSKT